MLPIVTPRHNFSATMRHLLLAAASTLAALLFTEVALRLVGPVDESLELRRYSVPILDRPNSQWVTLPELPVLRGDSTADPRLKFELPASAHFRLQYDASKGHRRPYMQGGGSVAFVDVSTTASGYRSNLPTEDKAPGIKRLVGVGDSFLFGDGVPNEATFFYLVGQALQGVESFNLGVPGYDITDVLATTQVKVPALHPDIVLYTLILNDPPAHLSPDLAALAGEALKLNRELFAAPTGLAHFSALARLIQKSRSHRALDTAYRAVVQASFEKGTGSRNGFDSALLQMRDEVEALGAQFIVVIFPLLNRLDGAYPFLSIHQDLRGMFEDEGIVYLDLQEIFEGRDASELWVHPTDQHPNEIAHKIAADALLPFLQKRLEE